MSDFASMLKYLREREHLSQRELAVKLGMSASAIGMYESGKRQPRFEDEEAIADFFNVDINTLRGRNVEKDLRDLYVANAKTQELFEIYRGLPPEKQAMFEAYAKRIPRPRQHF